jgi:hypothetical protein
MRGQHHGTSTNHREGNSEEGLRNLQAISKLVSNFKEANKNLIIVQGSENFDEY